MIIKKAYQVSAVTILDKRCNKTKMQEIPKEETNNRSINTNRENNKKITKSNKTYNKTLTKKEKYFQTNYIPKTSNFYGPPNIHKSVEINKAVEIQKSDLIEIPNPRDLKFRPMVADPSCTTNKFSKLIDIFYNHS